MPGAFNKMFDEIIKKFPDLIQALLQKVSQSDVESETSERKEAREKLITQLRNATEELSRLSQQPGERLTEEQMKEILSIPRPLPQNIPWAFLINQKGRK